MSVHGRAVSTFISATPDRWGCARGDFKDRDIDIKGVGGQTVAPGAIRQDGARYEALGSIADILMVPDLPASFAKALKAFGTSKGTSATAEAMGVLTLAESDIPEFADLFKGPMAKYDLDGLLNSSPKFKALFEHGLESCADARWKMAEYVMGEWRSMTIQELASFYSECPGAGVFVDSSRLEKGEFTYRDIWKEYTKTARKVAEVKLGAVDEENSTNKDLPLSQQQIARIRLKPSLMQIVPPSQIAPRKWFYQRLVDVRCDDVAHCAGWPWQVGVAAKHRNRSRLRCRSSRREVETTT